MAHHNDMNDDELASSEEMAGVTPPRGHFKYCNIYLKLEHYYVLSRQSIYSITWAKVRLLEPVGRASIRNQAI